MTRQKEWRCSGCEKVFPSWQDVSPLPFREEDLDLFEFAQGKSVGLYCPDCFQEEMKQKGWRKYTLTQKGERYYLGGREVILHEVNGVRVIKGFASQAGRGKSAGGGE